MCKTAAFNKASPLPAMPSAAKISEQHTDNLYGLVNMEASEEQAITGGTGGSHWAADPWSFHWTQTCHLLVFVAAAIFVEKKV